MHGVRADDRDETARALVAEKESMRGDVQDRRRVHVAQRRLGGLRLGDRLALRAEDEAGAVLEQDVGAGGAHAAVTAKAFSEALPLTGVILTKTDGDARGGAALSVRYVTGRPIKFIGTGEKPTDLEPFYPDRLAGRILGMGDVVGLVELDHRLAEGEDVEHGAMRGAGRRVPPSGAGERGVAASGAAAATR